MISLKPKKYLNTDARRAICTFGVLIILGGIEFYRIEVMASFDVFIFIIFIFIMSFTYFTPFFTVSVVAFEQVNVFWLSGQGLKLTL